MPTRYDVAVAGSGPAGLATAAACAAQGLRVVVVAPGPEASWPAIYGLWEGEAEASLAYRWAEVRVVGTVERRLGRGYGLIDNDALQATLLGSGIEVLNAAVAGVAHEPAHSSLHLAGGGVIEASVVVDASGHAPILVDRPSRPRPAWQVAHGIVAFTDRPPAPAGTCTLMDWTGPATTDPTFLYAMDLGDGRWFLEETSLARRPALDIAVARQRLDERLARLGVRVLDVLATEAVHFPMGTAVPRPQRVVGAGAAAGLVHPATGYSVGASLRAAPRLAAAVASSLGRGAAPEAAARAAWEALWPPAARRARAMHQYGLSALLRLDRSHGQRFFDAFFALPAEQWQGYLAGGDLGATVAAMRSVFGALDLPMKGALAAGNPLAAWWASSAALSGRPI